MLMSQQPNTSREPADVGLSEANLYAADNDKQLMRFLELCDPDAPLDSLDSHIACVNNYFCHCDMF